MSAKKKPPSSADVRDFEEKLLERGKDIKKREYHDLAESETLTIAPPKEITIQDTHASSLENWLEEFLTTNPKARNNLDGARALCRVSENSAEKWPSMPPQRNYNNTKYSNTFFIH